MNSAIAPVIATLQGSCVGGVGPDLSKYPNLVVAPAQHGEGVRCASNGARVEDVAHSVLYNPIVIASGDHNVSVHEALDALQYCRANGLI